MTWTDEERIAVADRFADHRIFVSIVAFRDRELAATIRRAFDAADRPSRLRFGICHQFDEENASLLDGYVDDPRVVVDRVPFRESRGAGWARARANGLFDSERYVLQLDAPTEFVDGWDRRLIDLLGSTGSARPIITGYPPAAGGSDGGTSPRGLMAPAAVGSVLTTRLTAGELFTHGRFVIDVPADPEISADAEDLTLTLRAYTHGHDFFRPTESILYRRYEDAAPRPSDADDERGRRASRETLACLLRGDDRGMGARGLGCLRTIAAYDDFVGRGLDAPSDGPPPDRQ